MSTEAETKLAGHTRRVWQRLANDLDIRDVAADDGRTDAGLFEKCPTLTHITRSTSRRDREVFRFLTTASLWSAVPQTVHSD